MECGRDAKRDIFRPVDCRRLHSNAKVASIEIVVMLILFIKDAG
jgi:hypothetical protein